MSNVKLLFGCTGFEWDKHNTEKIWTKHEVSPAEGEQIFFNLPLVVDDTVKYSEGENRFYALGRTDANRHLFVAFTVRTNNIRIISARDMSRKERNVYNSHEKENT